MKLSALPKTWLIDVDGTILKHNGYLIDGSDTILEASLHFLSEIPVGDKVILLTARAEEYRDSTINFLKECGVRFDEILFNIPIGERILINDEKPSGLKTAFAVNLKRDSGIDVCIEVDSKL